MIRLCVALVAAVMACGSAFAQGQLPSPRFAGALATQVLSPTVQTAAYGSGNNVGGLLQFTASARDPVDTGFVSGLAITMLDAQSLTLDVWVFDANPTASTFTDRGAFTVADADRAKVVDIIHISDCTGTAPTVCKMTAFPSGYKLTGQTLYLAFMTRSAFTPTAPTWTVKLTTQQN